MFLNLKLIEGGIVAFRGMGKGEITSIGNIGIPSLASIDNVLYVEGLTYNLLSISQFFYSGYIVSFNKDQCIVKTEDNNVRDRGSNMKTRPWSLKKLEEVLYFTCLTLLSGICINCCIVCCILVFIFSYVHHASSYRSKKIVSKVRNFFQCIKLFFLSITR